MLHEPEFPLVAIVFDGQASYAKYAHAEIGDTANSIIGYYNLKTNRMISYDLTGVEAGGLGDRNAAAQNQADSLAARGGADGGHDRSRGDAPARLQ